MLAFAWFYKRHWKVERLATVSHLSLRVGFPTPGGGAFMWDVGLLSSRLLGTDLSSTASPLKYAVVMCFVSFKYHDIQTIFSYCLSPL